ncbi:MAG: helix-turn-helix transcriptional regulator [Acidimicrobiia bacterium]|nr:helix-turn-helix transcriptional regulator [Acidimicrobiia bacterium]
MSHIGDTIKNRRLSLGQSRGQLASRLNTTATIVADIERGVRQPDADTINRLARALGVDPAQLTGSPRGTPDDPNVPAPARAATTVSGAVVAGDGFDGFERIPVVTGPVAAGPRPASRSGAFSDLVDAPTEAVPVVGQHSPLVIPLVAPNPSPAAAAESAPGTYGSFQRFLATVFDPDRSYLFWIRTALTIVMLLVGFRVLAWAVPALFDALGDILGSIESTNPTPTTIPGN